MAVQGRVDPPGGVVGRVRTILEMIKFEHTVFALPFALIGALLASRSLPRGMPAASTIFWILIAMVSARSAAMAFNRVIDARYDAQNPRTARRAIPAGILAESHVWVFTAVSAAIFVFATAMLNPLCLALSPVALAAVLGYSFTKRFTSLSHLALGFGIGIAPIGAWIAVTGSLDTIPLLLGATVMLWIGGFDIIYALQDVDFDQQFGLHSLPRALGGARALLVSRAMHLLMLALLIGVGLAAGLGAVYYAGVVVVAVLIVYEHSIVSPEDLSRVNVAFFTMNGWVGVALFAFVLADLLIKI